MTLHLPLEWSISYDAENGLWEHHVQLGSRAVLACLEDADPEPDLWNEIEKMVIYSIFREPVIEYVQPRAIAAMDAYHKYNDENRTLLTWPGEIARRDLYYQQLEYDWDRWADLAHGIATREITW